MSCIHERGANEAYELLMAYLADQLTEKELVGFESGLAGARLKRSLEFWVQPEIRALAVQGRLERLATPTTVLN